MPDGFDLNPEWPHTLMLRHPDEIHISPRTAYFTRDGVVTALRLEDLTDESIADAGNQLRAAGVDYPEE